MYNPIKTLNQYHNRRRGVTNIEYGLLTGLIAIVAIASITILGSNNNNLYCTIEGMMISSTNIGSNHCNNTQIFGDVTDQKNDYNGHVSCGDICTGDATSVDSNLLEAINNRTPIVAYAGLFNPDGSAATSLDQAIDILNLPADGESGYSRGTENVITRNGTNYIAEIKTSDGQTYGLFYSGGNMQYRNLITNQTYAQNSSTGIIEDEGVTH